MHSIVGAPASGIRYAQAGHAQAEQNLAIIATIPITSDGIFQVLEVFSENLPRKRVTDDLSRHLGACFAAIQKEGLGSARAGRALDSLRKRIIHWTTDRHGNPKEREPLEAHGIEQLRLYVERALRVAQSDHIVEHAASIHGDSVLPLPPGPPRPEPNMDAASKAGRRAVDALPLPPPEVVPIAAVASAPRQYADAKELADVLASLFLNAASRERIEALLAAQDRSVVKKALQLKIDGMPFRIRELAAFWLGESATDEELKNLFGGFDKHLPRLDKLRRKVREHKNDFVDTLCFHLSFDRYDEAQWASQGRKVLQKKLFGPTANPRWWSILLDEESVKQVLLSCPDPKPSMIWLFNLYQRNVISMQGLGEAHQHLDDDSRFRYYKNHRIVPSRAYAEDMRCLVVDMVVKKIVPLEALAYFHVSDKTLLPPDVEARLIDSGVRPIELLRVAPNETFSFDGATRKLSIAQMFAGVETAEDVGLLLRHGLRPTPAMWVELVGRFLYDPEGIAGWVRDVRMPGRTFIDIVTGFAGIGAPLRQTAKVDTPTRDAVFEAARQLCLALMSDDQICDSYPNLFEHLRVRLPALMSEPLLVRPLLRAVKMDGKVDWPLFRSYRSAADEEVIEWGRKGWISWDDAKEFSLWAGARVDAFLALRDFAETWKPTDTLRSHVLTDLFAASRTQNFQSVGDWLGYTASIPTAAMLANSAFRKKWPRLQARIIAAGMCGEACYPPPVEFVQHDDTFDCSVCLDEALPPSKRGAHGQVCASNVCQDCLREAIDNKGDVRPLCTMTLAGGGRLADAAAARCGSIITPEMGLKLGLSDMKADRLAYRIIRDRCHFEDGVTPCHTLDCFYAYAPRNGEAPKACPVCHAEQDFTPLKVNLEVLKTLVEQALKSDSPEAAVLKMWNIDVRTPTEQEAAAKLVLTLLRGMGDRRTGANGSKHGPIRQAPCCGALSEKERGCNYMGCGACDDAYFDWNEGATNKQHPSGGDVQKYVPNNSILWALGLFRSGVDGVVIQPGDHSRTARSGHTAGDLPVKLAQLSPQFAGETPTLYDLALKRGRELGLFE